MTSWLTWAIPGGPCQIEPNQGWPVRKSNGISAFPPCRAGRRVHWWCDRVASLSWFFRFWGHEAAAAAAVASAAVVSTDLSREDVLQHLLAWIKRIETGCAGSVLERKELFKLFTDFIILWTWEIEALETSWDQRLPSDTAFLAWSDRKSVV